MKIQLYVTLVLGLMITPSYAFVRAMTLQEKTQKSDIVVRGVVIDMINVARKVKDSRGSDENILEGNWTGPSSVAVVRIVSVIKGKAENINTVIFVPCGYSFDESPSELTESKDYILFLESMKHNYYHPSGPFCMHRVQKNMVGLSGFDWKGDFDPKDGNPKVIEIEKFTASVISFAVIDASSKPK